MPEITANYAARNLAEILEAVEEQGETFTVVRRGRVVAEFRPVAAEQHQPVAPAEQVAVPLAEATAQVIDLRQRRPDAVAARAQEAAAGAEEQTKHRRRFSLRHPFWLRNRSRDAA